jgi:simple sugar transport system ATP-binding protein
MVGEEVASPRPAPANPGKTLLEMNEVSAQTPSGIRIENASLALRAGEITGIAGVSGNGQSAIAGLIEGTLAPLTGTLRVMGSTIGRWSPREALSHRIGRIPEDRHATGMIGDMSVTENVISEAYRSPRFSRHGLLDWAAARQFAQSLITAYDVKCPSPEARVRLLSGGNMQKLILGRALDGDPAIIIANQPTRGLDVGAVAYVHSRLIEARDRGAAILLISEDLDEVLALSDRIVVMSKGRLSPPSARGERTIRQIAELMAGHFEPQAHADVA